MTVRRFLKLSTFASLGAVSATLLAAVANNTAPVITSKPYPVAEAGQAYAYPVRASDAESNAISYSIESGPADMTYSDEAKSIKWLPAQADVGVQQVTVRARDSWGAYSEQRFDLHTVADFCEIYPIALPQSLLATARSGQLLSNIPRGTGVGNFSWLTWTGAVNAPTLAASLLSPGDSYSYVNPDNASDHLLEVEDWAQAATGSMNSSEVRDRLETLKSRDIILPIWKAVRGAGAKFDYQVAAFAIVRLKAFDLTGQGSLSMEFRGFKNCYNDAPTAQPQSLQTKEDESLPIQLHGDDPESDPLEFTVLQQPSHGRLEGSGAQLTYVPNANYFGTDQFSYQANDGELASAPAVVSIAVIAVNDRPAAQGQSVQTNEDVPLQLHLSATDVEGDALSYTLVQPPLHGTISGSGEQWTYTPARDFYGVDHFSWSASDGTEDSTPAEVQIDVIERNDPPVANALHYTTNNTSEVQIDLSGSDPDGDRLAFRVLDAPSSGNLSGTPPQLIYTPPAGYSGDVQFQYVANDGRLDSAAAVVTITVLDSNHAPTITSTPANFVPEMGAYQYGLTATDPDAGDLLHYGASRAQSGLTVNTDTGKVDWSALGGKVAGVRERNLACKTPAPRASFDPVLKWWRKGPEAASAMSRTLGPALVAELTDDNGDGRIDASDQVDVISLTHASDNVGSSSYLVAMSGKDGSVLFQKSLPFANVFGAPAVGDIDGDGKIEIAVLEGANGSNMTVLENDGTVKWKVAVPPHAAYQAWSRDPIAIADLDADGSPELIRGATIVNNDGTVRCTGAGDKGGVYEYAYIPVVADIDQDGRQEIISGRTIYDSQCRILRTLPAGNDGYVAVGNFDADPQPEIVLVSNGSFNNPGVLWLFNSNGTKIFGPVNRPGPGAGGPPTLANVDDDPYPEIAIAGATRFAVFDNNGALLWAQPTVDLSSHQTGSTFFDFEGDGHAEVVYGDEQNFFIWDGRTGEQRLKLANPSATAVEYPVVADLDGDHSAEVIVGMDAGTDGGGLRVFSSASHSWSDARALWNQHASSITNINDDGSIPRRPEPSWLAHNTFRLNSVSRGQPAGQPDLAVFDLRLDPQDEKTIRLTAVNRGLAKSQAGTVVRVRDGSDANARIIGTISLPVMDPGQELALALTDVDAHALGDELLATIDEIASVEECAEDNNAVSARVFHVRATDRGGLFDEQVFTVGVTDVNSAPVFHASTPSAARIGHLFTHQVHASDADIGDGLLYSLVSGPTGMSIEPVSGELRWTPAATQTGAANVVVKVTDLRGLSATQNLSVQVPANGIPVFTTAAPTAIVALDTYRYAAKAEDPDGDLLSYRLVSGPAGMQINGATGLVSWQPNLQQGGTASVTLRVEDPFGGFSLQSFDIAVALPENHAPVFDSSPLESVALGQEYRYESVASDPDGDELRFELLEAPAGMAVDTVTGRVVWQPRSDQLGEHAVRLQVSDARGGQAEQQFTVIVSNGIDDGNHPPSINSVPETFAPIGGDYSYQVLGSDLDGDALRYSLGNAPAGMSIDAATGMIRWKASAAQAGLNEIDVVVTDSRGATATQSFGILAATSGGGSGNHPPAITSEPLTQVTLGQTYRYYSSASDPDGDALAFALLQGPAGMSIDPVTGVLAWTPPALGPVTVSIRVSDGRGGTAVQTFVLTTVSAGTPIDHRPVVTATPFGNAKVGEPYLMQLQVVDADGDAMHFELMSGPEGASVDPNSGLVTWTPATTGSFAFTVRISSGNGYTDTSWTVNVVPEETPLSLQVVVNPERVTQGAPYVAGLNFAGAAGPVTITARLNSVPVALDADGATTLVAPSVPGHYALSVTIDDGRATASDTADLFVSDPADATPPTVSITSPSADARVTAPTPVFGEVTGDDVSRWSLSLQDNASGSLTPIAEGTSAHGAGALGTLDPTLAVNGFYTLVLKAWDDSGNVAQTTRTVLIDGEMKLGHFSLSFEDVSIPMAGMPIRVTRTYDTRRRNERLDFGWGWSVDYQNVRLTESRAPGYSWTLVSERNGFFGNWCVRPNGDPIVAVTGPDGKLMKFRAKASPECQFAAPQPDVNIVFEALPGTNAQLEQTDYDIVRLTQVAGSGVYNLLDMGDTEQAPANPSHYRLKLPDGTVYSITQGVGLTQVSEPDGNTLTYNAGGIHHSRGQDLTFLRDGQGRIEQIVLPDGRRRRYTYTAEGDLEIAVDTGLDLTSFTYLPQAPHYLRDIIDPRGVHVSRNDYDDNGRLVATIDAEGHRIEYTHNLDGRLETIKDRRGYASTYAYDSEGRVTAESNARGETTLHKYDANGNELETADPLLHVTKRTFDARGNLLTETNPLGQKVTRTYDDKNNVLTQVDALGRTVARNAYHAYNGKLVMTQDALGGVTTFGYDSGLGSGGTGELTGIVGADNAATRYELNFFGHRFRETNAAGGRTDYELDTAGRVHGEYKYVRQADGSTEALWTHYTLDDKDRIVSTRHPDGSTSTVEYDGNGKPLKSCDGLNRCTLQSYNDRGELERTTYPDGTYEESQYDESGNVSSRRDRGGRVTKMEYDEVNRLVETILPDATPGDDADNPRTKSEYDAAGRMTASIDELGHRTTYGYDDAGRRVWVKDALGHVTTTDYDAAGQRVAVTDALGHTTRFVYDLAGRLVQTVHPDTTPTNPGDNPRTSIEYDATGRKSAEIDELGRRKQYTYDALGRLVAVTLPNPATGLIDGGELVTRYAYDDAGNKIRQIDALGRITAWEYDAMGRQIRRVLPGGQSESMQYDAAGQLVAKTDFNGVATRYSYDAAGRLAGTDYAHDADVITTYTDSGQRESVTDGQGTTLYQYDARDRLVRVQYPDGNVIAYGYDAAGNRTALHSPAQDQAFVFDELNRLSEVHTRVLGGAERVVRYGYDAVGNRTALTQADGTNTTTVFDERNRLRQLLTRTAVSVLLFGATYDVDATGARIAIAESDASGPTRSVGYAYDGVKRMTAEVITRAGQPARATEYTYDAVGNRLTKTEAGTPTTYVVDDNDRLLSETTAGTTTIYSYDSNGNTTGQAKPGSWTRYTFDEANRLVRTQTSAGVDAATGYGAEGVRNRETVVGGPSKAWLIDANRDYAQTLEAYVSGQLTTTWTYGNELLSQVNVGEGGMRERNLSTDGMGSIRQATDALSQLTDTFEYDAFGNDVERTGVSDIDHRYRSEQLDPNTGFYYLRARWLTSGTGRFLSADAWRGSGRDPSSLHKYLYASADPVDNADPTGFQTLSDLCTAVRVQVQSSLSAIRTGFEVSSSAGGTALRNLGLAVEDAVGQVLRNVLGETAELGPARLFGPGGRRVIDFWIRVGDRVAYMEVKYGLPRFAGPALQRLVGQILTGTAAAQNAEGAFVLFTWAAPSEAQMALLLEALGPEATMPEIVSGLPELITWTRNFFSLV